MRSFAAASVVAFMIAGGMLAATDDDGYPAGRVIGSVEIPALHDAVNNGSVDSGPTPAVTLYIEPTDKTAVAAVVAERGELASLEHGYELTSATVFDMRTVHERVWYQLQYATRTGSGIGWLSSRDAGTYHPLSAMLIDGLAFLTESWDRVLYDAPRVAANAHTVLDERKYPDVRVLATAGDPRHLWLQIALLDSNICTATTTPAVVARGWIPAHSAAGRLTAWHYSRGC